MLDLTPQASREWRANRRAAFRKADRRNRIVLPDARDFLARAMALRDLGHENAAQRDLESACGIDPTDPDVNHALLKFGPERGRDDAARRLLAHGFASDLRVEDAVQQLMISGPCLAHGIEFINGARVAGWVVWGADSALTLQIEHENASRDIEIAPQPGHPWSRFGLATAFDVAAREQILEARLLLDGEIRARMPNFRSGHSHAPIGAPDSDRRRAADHVLVIVPVYADLGATKACLESLAQQKASIEIRAVVVDDASPDGELKAYLSSACKAFGFHLLSNARNLGFVGAVNCGLIRHDGGDVLFLNADATLPERAVERLRRAVYSAPDIGTATPFSNNGEFTSFPVPFRANPLPSPHALVALDEIFREANASQTIALPSGVGFSLYVKRDCFEAVGAFSSLYAPGYGEDTEFCLTARLRGYRHVCAADVFVGHSGSLSFRAAKRALVKRNIRILEERFPDFRLECAAFLHADPLRSARGRAERVLPSGGATRLLAAAASPAVLATVQARADSVRRSEADKTVLLLLADGISGKTELKAFGSSSPQSLVFNLADEGERAALASYLRACCVDRVEIVGPGELTDEVYALSSSLGAPIDIICANSWPLSPPPLVSKNACDVGDLQAPCNSCRARYDFAVEAKTRSQRTLDILHRVLSKDSRILPLDPLAAEFAPFAFGRWPKAQFSRPPGASVSPAGSAVGVLAPTLSAGVDALLKRLGREIRRARLQADIVVLGACLDDEAVMASGAVFVTGTAQPAEYPEMISIYEIGLLFCPYPESHFWVFNEQLRELPKAYFDWSFGVAERREGDLAMDPRICDAKAVRQVISWISLRGGAGKHDATARACP